MVKFVEETEDAFVVFRGDADAVISDIEDRFVIVCAMRPDLDTRIGLFAHIYDGVLRVNPSPRTAQVALWVFAIHTRAGCNGGQAQQETRPYFFKNK